jgi:hypothetical protein
VPSVPTVSDLPGNYSLTASKKTDTCPAGMFPGSISNPGPIPVQIIGTGQNPPVSIGSTTTVIGLFNALTGAFEGSGSTTVTFNNTSFNLIEFIKGVFSKANAPNGETQVQLEGTLGFSATPAGGTACMAEYDAIYFLIL